VGSRPDAVRRAPCGEYLAGVGKKCLDAGGELGMMLKAVVSRYESLITPELA